MALPTTGISTSLVKTEIGAGSNDVGTLCIHPNINKWSKWKPVRSSKVVGLTLADLQNANFGLSIPYFSSLSLLMSAYYDLPGGGADWGYNRPRGLNYNEPYRLGDFRNYEEDALSPIMGGYTTNTVYTSGPASARVVRSSIMINMGSDYEIGYDDLSMSYQYFGIALHDGTSFVKTVINPTAGEPTVSFDVSLTPALPQGNYVPVPFLSSSASATTNIIGLHGVTTPSLLVRVVSSPVTVSQQITWEGTGDFRTVKVRMIFSNSLGDNIDLLNCQLKLRRPGNEFMDIIEEGEKLQAIGTLTVQPTDMVGTYVDYYFYSVEYSTSWRVWWDNTGSYPNRLAGAIITEM